MRAVDCKSIVSKDKFIDLSYAVELVIWRNFMEAKFLPLAEKIRAFEEKFTPSIKEYGSSEMYFDFENKCNFYPTTAQLRDCMDAYAAMIALAASLTQTREDSDESTGWLLNSSELLLGYLGRSHPLSIAACKPAAQVISVAAKQLLTLAEDPFLDQNGRLISLGHLLAEQAGIEFSYEYEDSEPEEDIW